MKYLLLLTFLLNIYCCNAATFPVSDHCDGEVFFNTEPSRKKSFTRFIKWISNRDKNRQWPRQIEAHNTIPAKVVGDGELVATLINHASVLLQHGGVNIITDPIYSERASPAQFVGPKRKAAAGVTFENLPTIHIVLISHNHYDHLDDYTIKQLKRVHNPIFITPLGNCKYISSDKCIELDWWQSHKYNDFNITLTPAKHWSKRGLFDYNKSLWGSFIISMPNKQNIFFSGDTAYGGHFKNIASKFHNIVLAMLPIGAYRPDFIMKDSHASPAESVLAHIDLSAKKSLGIHYGTFELSDDDYFLPIKDLTLSKKEMNIKSEDFVAALNGEQLRIKIK